MGRTKSVQQDDDVQPTSKLGRTRRVQTRPETGETGLRPAPPTADDHVPGGFLRLPRRIRAAAGRPLPRPRQKGQRRLAPRLPLARCPSHPSRRLAPWISREF